MLKKFKAPMVLLGLILFLYAPMHISFADSDSDYVAFENIDYNKTSFIRVFLDGREIKFDVKPQMVQSRVMVPMRAIFQEFGLNVSWNQANQTVIASDETNTISFTVGSNKAVVNFVEQNLDAPVASIRGTTMIPLRFLSENMGYNIVWNSDANIILLSKSNILEWRYGGYEKVAPYKEFEIKYYNGIRTDEMRYTGKNHNVQFYNIYTASGKLSQNVPEYALDSYGKGWLQSSPFVNKTYWVDYRLLEQNSNFSILYSISNNSNLSTNNILETSTSGNFVKLSIQKHYFDIDLWKKLTNNAEKYGYVAANNELDGEIILREDTLFNVLVNDKEEAVVLAKDIFALIDHFDQTKYTGVLNKDPKNLYKFSASDWDRLKGNTPWVGMSSDMLMLLKMKSPDKNARVDTKYSKFELWVYEDEHAESIYVIKDGVLISIL